MNPRPPPIYDDKSYFEARKYFKVSAAYLKYRLGWSAGLPADIHDYTAGKVIQVVMAAGKVIQVVMAALYDEIHELDTMNETDRVVAALTDDLRVSKCKHCRKSIHQIPGSDWTHSESLTSGCVSISTSVGIPLYKRLFAKPGTIERCRFCNAWASKLRGSRRQGSGAWKHLTTRSERCDIGQTYAAPDE